MLALKEEIPLHEYNLDFAKHMSMASLYILEHDSESEGAKRAALYNALVSCEISLKAALEIAGHPINKIRAKSHNLASLVAMVSSCTVVRNITESGHPKRVPATCIRSREVVGDTTAGHLLEAEKYGASVFPQEIRYGEVVSHFDVKVISKLSAVVLNWVIEHSDDIQA